MMTLVLEHLMLDVRLTQHIPQLLLLQQQRQQQLQLLHHLKTQAGVSIKLRILLEPVNHVSNFGSMMTAPQDSFVTQQLQPRVMWMDVS